MADHIGITTEVHERGSMTVDIRECDWGTAYQGFILEDDKVLLHVKGDLETVKLAIREFFT